MIIFQTTVRLSMASIAMIDCARYADDERYNIKPDNFITEKYVDVKQIVNYNKIKQTHVTNQNNEINIIYNETSFKHINNAEIIILDYDQLKKDFTFFKDKTDSFINSYMLDNCAIMSNNNHHKKETLYSELETTKFNNIKENKNVQYYRPPQYGRSIVYKDNNNQIELDLKGVGTGEYFKLINDSDNIDDKIYTHVEYMPEIKSHKTGMFPLGEAIEEYFNEHNFRNIIEHDDILKSYKIQTLKSYGIIKLNLKLNTNEECGIYIRQTVNREIDLFNHDNKLKLSTIFSKYGIGTHANDGNYLNLSQYINIQGSSNDLGNKIIYLIDFSGYYYYRPDNIYCLTKNNIIKYMSIKINDKIVGYLHNHKNLRHIIKNYDNVDSKKILEIYSTYFNEKLDDTNKFKIYEIIKTFSYNYISKIEYDEIIKAILNKFKKIFDDMWFTCSLTDTDSMREFCENGNYDIEIRRNLLEKYNNQHMLTDVINRIKSDFSMKKKDYTPNNEEKLDIDIKMLLDSETEIEIDINIYVDVIFESIKIDINNLC